MQADAAIHADASKLCSTDLDALFKGCRLSLRIPQRDLENSKKLSADSTEQNETRLVEDIIGNLPLRPFLYQGERADAFVVAVIPNTDQLRWSLALAMKRRDRLMLSQGELAVSAKEMEQFFFSLRFQVVAHHAKTTTTTAAAADSSQATHRQPGHTAPVHNVIGVSCTSAFSASIQHNEDDKILRPLIKRLDNGSWCCAYPFTINVPSLDDQPETPVESALLFEIRAVCHGYDPLSHFNVHSELAVYGGNLSDRSAHLEELSIRASSWMSAYGDNTWNTNQFEQMLSPNSNDSGSNVAATMSHRMIQALVPTRSILNASIRLVSLPPSFGTDTALVEVCVRCDPSIGKRVSLDSVQFMAPQWHIEQIGLQMDMLPFSLDARSCFQIVFRASPLVASDNEEIFQGLKLLNIGGQQQYGANIRASSTAVIPTTDLAAGMLNTCMDSPLIISFITSLADADANGGDRIFEVSQRILSSSSKQKQHHSQKQMLLTDQADSIGQSSALETIKSPGPLSTFSYNTRSTTDRYQDQTGSISTPAEPIHGHGHTKTVSLDHKHFYGKQPRIRKYSLAFPQQASFMMQPESETTQGTTQRKQRPTSMLRVYTRSDRSSSILRPDHPLTSPIGNSKHGLLSMNEREFLSEQRVRAATINAFGTLPSQQSQRTSLSSTSTTTVAGNVSSVLRSHYPRSSVSTIQSAASATGSALPYLQLSLSQDIADRASLRRRPSVGSVLATDPLNRTAAGPRATFGTIEMSFEAPPKVNLGEELTVLAYITNNTNTHYFRLSLVDDIDATGVSAAVGTGFTGTQGLVPLDHVTHVPPLRPGESTFVALKYIAAVPHFHAVSQLRLVNLDSDAADKTVISIESPFVVFVDDSNK
ncbi:hypothetical protein BX070DRAFT_252337 [Coemansia spiralis]|nr:hypothetical protein BX070DRAFT_252337 [Coemansia spiralis]